MTGTYDTDVAIVGGGPVGTALAIALAQQGIGSIVIERHPTPQPVPKGQNLTQRTMEHFRRWGLEGDLRGARTLAPGQPSAGMTAFGTLSGEYQYPWLQRARLDGFYAARNERLPQYATEAVLRSSALATPEIDYRAGWTAEQIEHDADGVTIGLTASGGERDAIRARYVVGADGSRSRVREAVGITQTLADHDRVMVLLVFRSPEFDTIMERFPGVAFVNVMNAELEGYWQFFGRVDASETWFFHAPVEAERVDGVDLSALLERAVGQRFAFEVEYLGQWDLRFALADSYRSGRAFIAGDACHSHPPYGGYGINSGFEDATNLAWKLAAEIRGWAGPALLDSYDAERRPVFASTRDDFIDRAIRDDRDFLAVFDPERDRAAFEAEWAHRDDGAQREVDAFEPHYEGSPIVGGVGSPSALGGHTMEARAGHHLAPGTTSDGVEVFDALARDGLTLLAASGAETTPFREVADRLGVPLTVVGVDADTAARYQAALVLVRPDEYVAWAGEAASDASSVLSLAIGS
ncbi:FAD-dependent monooxygenase [Microbacterium sp. NPDC096154]|uniref:FAD-dependent monooxygenase n=1 Tax=Microbacterium sp. NPDC096154 TaxID=3155549 RepID=UPI0033281B71